MKELYRTNEYIIVQTDRNTYLIVSNILKIPIESKIEAVKKIIEILRDKTEYIPRISVRNTRYWSLKVNVRI